MLRATRTARRQRLYRREDVMLLRRIQSLLKEEGMTIAGACRRLRDEREDRVIEQKALRFGSHLSDLASKLEAGLKELKQLTVD